MTPPPKLPGTVPSLPGKRVRFRHPDTGDDADGHVHAAGAHGATIVDHTGATHKVPHGHYQFHAEESGGVKPSAKTVKAAAIKHLELGASAPLAIYAAAALVSIGGVKTAHALSGPDVEIRPPFALFRTERLKTSMEPLVKVLGALKQQAGSGPLFRVDGKPITEEALTQYVRRFGGQGLGGRETRPANPTDDQGAQQTSMTKAAASAMDLPRAEQADEEWEEHGYRCRFRKASTGIGILSIDGGVHVSMPIPLHEVVPSIARARALAPQLVEDLRLGRAPRRGVFQATRSP